MATFTWNTQSKGNIYVKHSNSLRATFTWNTQSKGNIHVKHSVYGQYSCETLSLRATFMSNISLSATLMWNTQTVQGQHSCETLSLWATFMWNTQTVQVLTFSFSPHHCTSAYCLLPSWRNQCWTLAGCFGPSHYKNIRSNLLHMFSGQYVQPRQQIPQLPSSFPALLHQELPGILTAFFAG